MYQVSAILESLVVALREGIEVSLVIGMLLAYLNRTGRRTYGRFVLFGLGAAVLASLGTAAAVQRYGLDAENPVVEGSLMFVAAALVTSLVVWMWRTGRSIRNRLEHRLDSLMGNVATTAVDSRSALAVFAVAFLMVLREGAETVLFLTALSGTPSGSALTTLVGSGLGLSLAILFGVLLVRGSVHVNLRRFFGVTGLVLLVLVIKLAAGGLHEFFEAGVLAGAPFWEEVVEVVASKAASFVVLALLIVAPLVSLAWEWWNAAPAAFTAREQPNGARS
jgi:high-affinity iron transporter